MKTAIVCNLLKKEFIKRSQINSSYSIRAYAKYLEVDHSLLSKIMRGKLSLSQKMAYKVGGKLGLTISQINDYIQEKSEKNESEQISEDIFTVMADWYHFAILELIKTKKSSSNVTDLSETLGVSELEIEMALSRLIRLGFIFVRKNNIFLQKSNNNWFDHEKSSESRKVLQKQLLAKALEAVDKTSFENRINSSLTIAINKNKIKKFSKKIEEFIKESGDFLNGHNKNEVYQLCVAFYPLTKEV